MADIGKLDVENRVEGAVKELLDDVDNLVTAVTEKANIRVAFDRTSDVAYPLAYFQAVGFPQFTNRTGWYMGSLRLGAVSYKVDDKDTKIVKNILGILRAWAQQDDLAAQINATASATTEETALSCLDVRPDDRSSDLSEGQKINEMVLDVEMLVRPSQG